MTYSIKTSSKYLLKPGFSWVKDNNDMFYVEFKDRGIFETRDEAEKIKIGKWEIVVENKDGDQEMHDLEKWDWMMDYCKRNELPAAQAWAWNYARTEYEKRYSGSERRTVI